MLRIRWPLALLLAAVLLLVGRRPRLLEPILVIFAVWLVWQWAKTRRRR